MHFPLLNAGFKRNGKKLVDSNIFMTIFGQFILVVFETFTVQYSICNVGKNKKTKLDPAQCDYRLAIRKINLAALSIR